MQCHITRYDVIWYDVIYMILIYDIVHHIIFYAITYAMPYNVTQRSVHLQMDWTQTLTFQEFGSVIVHYYVIRKIKSWEILEISNKDNVYPTQSVLIITLIFWLDIESRFFQPPQCISVTKYIIFGTQHIRRYFQGSMHITWRKPRDI